jgi:hypothetical protein
MNKNLIYFWNKKRRTPEIRKFLEEHRRDSLKETYEALDGADFSLFKREIPVEIHGLQEKIKGISFVYYSFIEELHVAATSCDWSFSISAEDDDIRAVVRNNSSFRYGIVFGKQGWFLKRKFDRDRILVALKETRTWLKLI